MDWEYPTQLDLKQQRSQYVNEHGYGENFLFVVNMFGENPGVVSGDKAIKKHYTVQNVTRYLQSQLNDYGTKFNQEMTAIKNTLNSLKESRTALESKVTDQQLKMIDCKSKIE